MRRATATTIGALLMTVLLDKASTLILAPLFPFYASRFSASATTIGWLIGIYSICQLFASSWLARMSDRIGRKPVLLMSQAGTVGSFIIIAWAQQLWVLFAGRILDGLTAGNVAVVQASLSDLAEGKERTRIFALEGAVGALGVIAGSLLSGMTLERLGYTGPALLAAGLAFMALIMTLVWVPYRQPVTTVSSARSSSPVSLLARPQVRRMALTSTAYFLAFHTFWGTSSLVFVRQYELTPIRIGYAVALLGVVNAFLQLLVVPRLLRELSETQLALVGLVCLTLGVTLFPVAHGTGWLVMLVSLVSAGWAIPRSCLLSLLTSSVESHERGAAVGLFGITASGTLFIGPVVGGMFIDTGDWALLGFCSGLEAVVAMLLLMSGLTHRARGSDTVVTE